MYLASGLVEGNCHTHQVLNVHVVGWATRNMSCFVLEILSFVDCFTLTWDKLPGPPHLAVYCKNRRVVTTQVGLSHLLPQYQTMYTQADQLYCLTTAWLLKFQLLTRLRWIASLKDLEMLEVQLHSYVWSCFLAQATQMLQVQLHS